MKKKKSGGKRKYSWEANEKLRSKEGREAKTTRRKKKRKTR